MKINKAYVRMRTKKYQEQSIKYKKITSFNFCNFLDLKVFCIVDVLYSNRYVNHSFSTVFNQFHNKLFVKRAKAIPS